MKVFLCWFRKDAVGLTKALDETTGAERERILKVLVVRGETIMEVYVPSI